MSTTAVKEYPILMAGRLVRATLEGRKTQTRRPMKPQPPRGECGDYEHGDTPPTCEWYDPIDINGEGEQVPGPTIFGAYYDEWGIKCPFGGPGDVLWVRENFDWVAGTSTTIKKGIVEKRWIEHLRYAADGGKAPSGKWTPSIHMPRWACRLFLEITGVRVERLQKISDDDCFAEGIDTENDRNYLAAEHASIGGVSLADGSPERHAFHGNWDSIYATKGYGWEANPFVWVIDYKRKESP